MIDLTDAQWHPIYFYTDGDVTFIRINKEHCTGGHQMIFERRMGNEENPSVALKYDDIPILPYNPAIYIMHIAYGGSTLLTRMFASCEGFAAYMEPLLHSTFYDDPKIPQLFTRTFDDEIPVIKTAPHEMDYFELYHQRHPDNKFILLHQTLKSFLMSCFKDETRLDQAVIMTCNSLSIDSNEIQSDEDKVRVFIRFWTSMMSKFKEVIDLDNVIAIESSELFDNPIRVLWNIANKTKHHITPTDIHTIQDKWINSHSKFGTPFTYQDRLDLEQTTYNKHKELFDKFNLDQIQEQYNLTVK